MTWLITDLETQTHPLYGNKSSPHNPDNYIVALGYCVDNKSVVGKYYYNKADCVDNFRKHFKEALQGQQVIVAHNLTFELHWYLKYIPDLIIEFMQRGGTFYCTQYAEYLLSHQTELYPKLEDTALKYGGTHKLDEVKALWDSGVLTSDIDQSTLMKYLCDENIGDIANTRRVLFAQVPLLKSQGMWDMFKLRMNSLVFNAFSTFNGLYINQDIAKKNQAEQELRISELHKVIREQLPKDLPNELEFSFTSGYHLSAFLYGGKIKYKAKVSYEPKKYEKVDAYAFTAHTTHEDFLVYLPISDYTGNPNVETSIVKYKSGKNKGIPKVFQIDSDVEKLKWGDKEYTFKGLINFDVIPSIIAEQFIGDQAEFKGKQELPCGTPVYSTKDDALTLIAKYADVAKPLSELKTLEKDTGTYYLRTDDNGKQSGMLQFVEPDNIIHHSLNSTSTVTTRLSGTKPNLQNIPRDGTSKVKTMFTSRYGSQGRIVEVDYSALEVVALASISGDKNLLAQLMAGTDMHCYRLAGGLGEGYESVYTKCHDKAHDDHKRYKQLRTDVKPKAFSAQYGASARGIAYSTGCTVEEAQEFLDTERELFPESSTFAQRVVRPTVELTGLDSKPAKEFINNRYELYRRGYFKAKGGTCYSFREYGKFVRGKTIYDYKDTQLSNYWCQGESSFIVQVACGRLIYELLKYEEYLNGLVKVINSVHDAIYLDCATEELAIKFGKITKEIMESTPKYLAEVIPAYKEWNYHTTPFPAEAEYGVDMMNKVSIK